MSGSTEDNTNKATTVDNRFDWTSEGIIIRFAMERTRRRIATRRDEEEEEEEDLAAVDDFLRRLSIQGDEGSGRRTRRRRRLGPEVAARVAVFDGMVALEKGEKARADTNGRGARTRMDFDWPDRNRREKEGKGAAAAGCCSTSMTLSSSASSSSAAAPAAAAAAAAAAAGASAAERKAAKVAVSSSSSSFLQRGSYHREAGKGGGGGPTTSTPLGSVPPLSVLKKKVSGLPTISFTTHLFQFQPDDLWRPGPDPITHTRGGGGGER